MWGRQLIDCPRGVAPERMPKADATGLAPEESADYHPPAHITLCAGGFGFCSSLLSTFRRLHAPSLRQVKIKSHFFGEVSERRPWA